MGITTATVLVLVLVVVILAVLVHSKRKSSTSTLLPNKAPTVASTTSSLPSLSLTDASPTTATKQPSTRTNSLATSLPSSTIANGSSSCNDHIDEAHNDVNDDDRIEALDHRAAQVRALSRKEMILQVHHIISSIAYICIINE
jgi:hypothetical protein